MINTIKNYKQGGPGESNKELYTLGKEMNFQKHKRHLDLETFNQTTTGLESRERPKKGCASFFFLIQKQTKRQRVNRIATGLQGGMGKDGENQRVFKQGGKTRSSGSIEQKICRYQESNDDHKASLDQSKRQEGGIKER